MNTNSSHTGSANLHVPRKCRQPERKQPVTAGAPATIDDLLEEVRQLRTTMATYRQLAERVIRRLSV